MPGWGLCQNPDGRPGGSAAIPVTIYTPHGHFERAYCRYPGRHGAAAGSRQRCRGQAGDPGAGRGVHRPLPAACAAAGLQADTALRGAIFGLKGTRPCAGAADLECTRAVAGGNGGSSGLHEPGCAGEYPSLPDLRGRQDEGAGVPATGPVGGDAAAPGAVSERAGGLPRAAAMTGSCCWDGRSARRWLEGWLCRMMRFGISGGFRIWLSSTVAVQVGRVRRAWGAKACAASCTA
jgi:hypothetical protein